VKFKERESGEDLTQKGMQIGAWSVRRQNSAME